MRQKTWALETGGGTVLALGLICAVLLVAGTLGAACDRFVRQARLTAEAENAAIAGADALRGLVAAYPCQVVTDFQAAVARCEVIGTDVVVTLTSGGLTASARAGEP